MHIGRCPCVSDSCLKLQQQCTITSSLSMSTLRAWRQLQTTIWSMYLSADRVHAVQAALACICFTYFSLAMCCWHKKTTRPHTMLYKQSNISKVHKPEMMKQPKHSCVTTLSSGVCCRRCKLWAVRGIPLSASCPARWALYSVALVFHLLLVCHTSHTVRSLHRTPGKSPKMIRKLKNGNCLCVIRESNPGLYRGRVLFYH